MPVYDKETDDEPKTQHHTSEGDDLASKEKMASLNDETPSDGSIQSGQSKQEAPGVGSRDLYTPSGSKSSPGLVSASKLSSLIKGGGTSKKAAAGLIGAALLAVVVVIGSLFGFLNTFKLDNIMKNIERKSFQRYQVSMDGRSDKWMQSYLRLRFAEVEDPNMKPGERENLLFRADRVDTDNPLKDWYQTLRTSKFEDDLLKKHGFKFTSVAYKDGGVVRFRAGKVTMDGRDLPDILSKSEIAAIKNGDINMLNGKLRQYVNVEIYDTGKAARKEIKKAVNAETHAWQVIKRRHVRKNIQNMIGVREWSFFEKTRDKLDEKKIAVRNKIIKKALPENTKVGKYIQCFFGASDCKASTDPIDPENRSSTATTTGTKDNGRAEDPNNPDPYDKPVDDGSAEQLLESETKNVIEEESEDLALLGLKMTIIKQIVAKLNAATGALSIIDALARIDKAISNGTLVKMVTIARGTQALGLFTTYSTASDQLRTGEVTAPEVSQFMQTVNAVSNSEGWVDVISNNGSSKASAANSNDFTAAKDRTEYCSPEHQEAIQDPKNHRIAEREFHYLCGSMQIGGTSRASTLTDWWNKTFGLVLGPLFSVYRASHIGKILDFFGGIFDAVLTPITNTLIKALNLEGTIESLMTWALTEVSAFLGAGPIMNGSEPSGVFLNNMLQGGSYGAESSARYQGASKTTSQSAALARQNTVTYLSDQEKQQSVFDKYLSLANQDSAVSKSLFTAIQDSTVNNVASIVSGYIKNLAKAPLTLFAQPAGAVNDDPYAAANFAGIDTFDFPKECMDLDPMTMKPTQVTNANDILSKNGVNNRFSDSELTWELVNNNTNFYDAVYAKIGNKNNADEIAQQIYDCAAMDTTIRGGLGAVYGYTDDNGLETSSAISDDNTSTTGNVAKNNRIYVLGDSLTVGMDNSLSQKLIDKGYTPKINGNVNRRISETSNSGLTTIENANPSQKDFINNAGTIVIALGTNDWGETDAQFKTYLNKLLAKLKDMNPEAVYYWVNYSATDGASRQTKLQEKSVLLGNFADNNSSNIPISIIDWASLNKTKRYTEADTELHIHPYNNYADMSELVASKLPQAPQTTSAIPKKSSSFSSYADGTVFYIKRWLK